MQEAMSTSSMDQTSDDTCEMFINYNYHIAEILAEVIIKIEHGDLESAKNKLYGIIGLLTGG